jgi:hypothetical protein
MDEMNISREAFLDLKQELSAKLTAGEIETDEAVRRLVDAGWQESLAIDFASVVVDGKGE